MAEPHPQPPAHWSGSEPRQVLAPDGSAVGPVPDSLDAAALRELYRWMVLARRLDRECIALQRQGELTVYPGHEGQEAAQIGSAWALGDCRFRVADLPRAAGRAAAGRRSGPVPPVPPGRGTAARTTTRATHFGPVCIPIATQIAPRGRYALGRQLDGSDDVTIAYFGDGATSEGDFHEAANLAGVRRFRSSVLPEQRMGDQRRRRRRPPARIGAAPRVRVPRRAGGQERRAGGVRGDARGASSGLGPAGPTPIEALTYRSARIPP